MDNYAILLFVTFILFLIALIYVIKLKRDINELKIHKEKNETIEKEFSNIKENIDAFDNMKNDLNKLAKEDIDLDGFFSLIRNHLWPQNKSIDKLRLAFDNINTLKKNADKIKLLQNRINDFYVKLNDHLVGQNEGTRIRTEYLELTLMMIDVIDSIDNPNYVDSLQGINVKLLTNVITIDQAYEIAKEATFDDRQTSQWARNLKKCIFAWSRNDGDYLDENKSYLLRGYKFSCDR